SLTLRAFLGAATAAVDVALAAVLHEVGAAFGLARRVAHAVRAVVAAGAKLAVRAFGARAAAIEVALGAVGDVVIASGRRAHVGGTDVARAIDVGRAGKAGAAPRARAAAIRVRLVAVLHRVRAGGRLADVPRANAALAVRFDVAGCAHRAR